jgi:hypothetical protein
MEPNLKFPETWEPLAFERRFTAAEYERLAMGYPPGDMDDHWFIYLEGDTLYFHRNWTGLCMYRLRLRADKDEYVATDFCVAQYPAPPEPPPRFPVLARLMARWRKPPPKPWDHSEVLNEVIDIVLLGKPIPGLPLFH